MLKLPRTSLSEEDLLRVQALFMANLKPISSEAPVVASHFSGQVLANSLKVTSRTGCLTQGLESIIKLLADEKKGLLETQKRTSQVPSPRMSRLLIIANDGSDRFLRQVASLLTEHADRLWAICLDVDSSELGGLVFSSGSLAKAILINDKKAIALFLTELARI